MNNVEYRTGEQARQACTMQTRVLDPENRIIEFIGSTETVDRYGTRLIGWDTKAFKRNPVLLWQHDYTMPPIGRVTDVRMNKDKQLVFRVQYVPRQLYPFAGTAYDLVAEGYMSAVSVGFIPKRVEPQDDGIVDLRDNELLELSQVSVPANPEALVNAFSRGLVPEGHKDFLVANRSEEVGEIDGTDIKELVAAVREWIEEESLEVEEPDESRDPQSEDEVTITREAFDELQARVRTADDELTIAKAEVESRGLRIDELEAKLQAIEEGIDDVSATGALVLIGRMLEVDLDVADPDLPAFVNGCREKVEERAGAVLSKRNRSALTEAQDRIQSVIDSAEAAKPDASEPEEKDVAPEARVSDELVERLEKAFGVATGQKFEEIERKIGDLADRIEDKEHNDTARALISKRGASATLLDDVLSKLERLGAK